MEAEAFPIRFTRGIRSYWRRRKYQRIDASGGGARGTPQQVARLGGGGRALALRLPRGFRVRVRVPTPMRVLGRARDVYVDAMIGAAKKGPALALPAPNGPAEGLWRRRVPARSRQARDKPAEFGQRLVFEMYKSVVASRTLSGMLSASTAR